MRKFIGTCLLCCVWSAPAWACYDEHVPVTNEPHEQPQAQPPESSQTTVPEIAAKTGRVPTRHASVRAPRNDWSPIRWGSAGVATLVAGIVLATVRNRRRLVASEPIATVTKQPPT